MVPRFDQGAAVAELVKMVNDGDYRQKLSQEAQEYALTEFTWSAVADKYLEVYQTPSGGGRA